MHGMRNITKHNNNEKPFDFEFKKNNKKKLSTVKSLTFFLLAIFDCPQGGLV